VGTGRSLGVGAGERAGTCDGRWRGVLAEVLQDAFDGTRLGGQRDHFPRGGVGARSRVVQDEGREVREAQGGGGRRSITRLIISLWFDTNIPR
jgi:hypothetical protein